MFARSVSVPLRGFVDRKQRYRNKCIDKELMFQSPCGDLLIGNPSPSPSPSPSPVSVPLRGFVDRKRNFTGTGITINVDVFQSPCGDLLIGNEMDEKTLSIFA